MQFGSEAGSKVLCCTDVCGLNPCPEHGLDVFAKMVSLQPGLKVHGTRQLAALYKQYQQDISQLKFHAHLSMTACKCKLSYKLIQHPSW